MTAARARFDETVAAALWVAVGAIWANVFFGAAALLYEGLDAALDVEFGGEE